MQESLQNIKIQRLSGDFSAGIPVDVLRLDLVDPVISGNKWFKLLYHLEEAKVSGMQRIATFGGAYSNHLLATAAAAAKAGLQSMAIVRGEPSPSLSSTLNDAAGYGMELVFVSREDYRDKEKLIDLYTDTSTHWIMEGGYGALAAKGAATITELFDEDLYTDILCAVGTGTMMAGLIDGTNSGIRVTGIPVLKGHTGLDNDIRSLLTDKTAAFELIDRYHFGGYAKQTAGLLSFMNDLWRTEGLPTDIIYTSKLLYAVKDLIQHGDFAAGSRLLVIHSGGLQGNRSLAPGTLLF